MLGNFGVFSFLRSWKLTCFLAIRLSATLLKTAAAEVETKLENVESEVKIATSELAKVKANVDDVKQAVQSGIKKGM